MFTYVRRKDLPFGHDVSRLFPVLYNLLKILLTLEKIRRIINISFCSFTASRILIQIQFTQR